MINNQSIYDKVMRRVTKIQSDLLIPGFDSVDLFYINNMQQFEVRYRYTDPGQPRRTKTFGFTDDAFESCMQEIRAWLTLRVGYLNKGDDNA